MAWVVAVNLALCLALIDADGQAQAQMAASRWSRLPRTIGAASLVGWPLTLGFTAHWSYLRLCWLAGLPGIALLASVSYLLASVPMWQGVAAMRRESEGDGSQPTWRISISLVGRSLAAAFLVFFGIELAASARAWPSLPGELQLASLRVLFRGDVKLLGVLALAAMVLPLAGSYVLHRLRVRVPDRSAGALRVAGALLELDWLYVAVERALARLQRLVELVSAAVEEPFYLGWTLFWGLVIILYLVGA